MFVFELIMKLLEWIL